MIPAIYITIFTANILGIFTDPFEFEGDYGSEVNATRQMIIERVVSKETFAKMLSEEQLLALMSAKGATKQKSKEYRNLLLSKAIEEDKLYGPSLSELIPPQLIQCLYAKQKLLHSQGFTDTDLEKILYFIQRYGDQKAFYFLRHSPSILLNLDRTLRDHAARAGKSFDLPILGSMHELTGHTPQELKAHFLESLFSAETFQLTKSSTTVLQALQKLPPTFLEEYLGEGADNQDLYTFCTPAGQTFFYWMYHALNLHLISQESDMIDQVNKVKHIFSQTLGNPTVRAEKFRDKLLSANSGLLFTQECDGILPKILTDDGLFLPVDKQNPGDGCFVFLNSAVWEPEYDVIPIEGYLGYAEGKISLILATLKTTGTKFLLASCHGNSTHPEDGRLQIQLVAEKFRELSQKPENSHLQLIIGIDANTKSKKDVQDLHDHLQTLGLSGTSVGPTTIKRRLVTTQQTKAGTLAIDEEDFLITLTPENGALFKLTDFTIGFNTQTPDCSQMLPNVHNLSDHYPVGATFFLQEEKN